MSHRDPISKRNVPEISLSNFPAILDEAINEHEKEYGFEAGVFIRSKLVLQARTGLREEYRGMRGLSRDSKTPSYLVFQNVDSYRGRILEKCREEWPITWIPRRVRHELYEIYKYNDDFYIFDWSWSTRKRLSKEWKLISKKHTGTEFSYHDLRKVSITWLYAMGLPLLRAARAH